MMNNKQLQLMQQKFKEEQETEGHAHDFTAARPEQRRRPKPPPIPTGTNVTFNVVTDGSEFVVPGSGSSDSDDDGSSDDSSEDGSAGEAATPTSTSGSPTKSSARTRRRRRSRGSAASAGRGSPKKKGKGGKRKGRRRSSINISVREGCGAGLENHSMQAAAVGIAMQFGDMNCSQRGDVSVDVSGARQSFSAPVSHMCGCVAHAQLVEQLLKAMARDCKDRANAVVASFAARMRKGGGVNAALDIGSTPFARFGGKQPKGVKKIKLKLAQAQTQIYECYASKILADAVDDRAGVSAGQP